MEAAFPQSVWTVSTSAPFSRRPVAAASSTSSSISARTRRIPSAAKRVAKPSPIPLAPPVTTATLPAKSCMSVLLVGAAGYNKKPRIMPCAASR